MAGLPSLRASDSDREQVADRLRDATVEGRLSADELEERLERLYASRTYHELDALLADLPVRRAPDRPPVRVPRWVGAAAVATLLAVLMGVLAVGRGHSAAPVAGTGHFRHFRHSAFPGPPADPYHGMIVTASVLGVVAALLICVALGWVLMRSRANSGA